MAESNAADRFLYSQLSGDSALTAVVGTRIHADLAPDTEATPYVVFSFLTGRDLMVVGAKRVWADMTYLVKAIDESETYMGNLKTAADRIDTVLHTMSGTNVDGTVYTVVREQPFRMVETDQGRQWRHLGGVFRIRAI